MDHIRPCKLAEVNSGITPTVMSGILAVYGLVIAVLIANDLRELLPIYTAFAQLAAGLSVGLSSLAAG